MIKPATTIDEVILALDEIIEREISLNSPLAYFPALYRIVTVRVKNGLTKNEFKDPLQMEQLDVHFANRYILAYQNFISGKPVTGSWRITFETNNKNLLILQHLLLGMNAHINLDLGIAAAGIMEGKPLAGLKNDFNAINRILAEMSDKVQSNIGKVSPLIGLLDRLAGNSDAILVKFSITEARDGAWKSANEFHASANNKPLLVLRDKKISVLGLALIYPNSSWVRTVLSVIRLAEKRNVRKVVGIITA